MSRLSHTFAELRSRGRKGLVPYVVAGDPSPEGTVTLLHALVAAGADVLEVGVPFSDPMS
jgi:tryptophan synthase alpha chain